MHKDADTWAEERSDLKENEKKNNSYNLTISLSAMAFQNKETLERRGPHLLFIGLSVCLSLHFVWKGRLRHFFVLLYLP